MQHVIVDNMGGVLPVLTLRTKEVYQSMPDGAYYSVMGHQAQIIVVGPMHFTPGQYLDALNDLVSDSFDHDYNAFMIPPNTIEKQKIILRRGFIDLRFRK